MSKAFAYSNNAATAAPVMPANSLASDVTYSSVNLGKVLTCQAAIDRDYVQDEFTEGLVSILKIRVRTVRREGVDLSDYRIDIKVLDDDDQVIAEQRVLAQDGEYEVQAPLDCLSSASRAANLKVELRFVELYEFLVAPTYEYYGFLNLRKRLVKPEHPEVRADQIDRKMIVINRHYKMEAIKNW